MKNLVMKLSIVFISFMIIVGCILPSNNDNNTTNNNDTTSDPVDPPSGTYYIDGTIGGVRYLKEGYIYTKYADIINQTAIKGADSLEDVNSANETWQITIFGNSTGTYIGSSSSIMFIIDDITHSFVAWSDHTVDITRYEAYEVVLLKEVFPA